MLNWKLFMLKINPHFLYNSLNTIAGLALVDGEKTRQMALALSRFFRYSINKEQTNLICVSEEIEMINTYLDIEKIRFGNQLDYKIECDTECEKRTYSQNVTSATCRKQHQAWLECRFEFYSYTDCH